MNAVRAWLNTLLLAAILTTLLLIWRRMPPTIGEMRAAKGDDHKALFLRSPYISPDIPDPVSVDVGQPLEVVVQKD